MCRHMNIRMYGGLRRTASLKADQTALCASGARTAMSGANIIIANI